MSSGLSTNERLRIVQEIFLIISQNEDVVRSARPKEDSFYLVRAILEDSVYPCTTRQMLMGILRKSPVWESIRPFIVNSDINCGQCKHGIWYHKGQGTKCKGFVYLEAAGVKTTPCKCQGFVRKEFK